MTRRTTPIALRRPTTPDADDEPESSERPTINPPFDVAAFARESDGKLRAVDPALLEVHPSPTLQEGSPELSGHTIENPLLEMTDRFASGHYSDALELAELILTAEPDNLEAAECGEACRSTLEAMLVSKFGSVARVPTLLMTPLQMRWLSLDHRAGFILSLVDGVSTIEQILDVCGMARLDALQILDELVKQKVIALR
jgi:hypothetical protein